MPGRWYSIKEAADLLAVSHDTVSRLVKSGELPAVRVSERIVRIPVPAFDVYASGRRPVRRNVIVEVGEHGIDVGDDEPLHASVAETAVALDPS
jgi:excisionase family DNA binding protein